MSDFFLRIESSDESRKNMVRYFTYDITPEEVLDQARQCLQEDSTTAVEIVERVRVDKVVSRLERGQALD